MYQIKFSIVNDTDYHLYMPSENNPDGTNPDFVLDRPSYLGPGSQIPPRCIMPRDPYTEPTEWAPTNRCDFVVCSPGKPIPPATTAPAPSGSLRLILACVKHEINLEWRDFTLWTVKRGSMAEDGTVTPLGKDEKPPQGEKEVSYVEGDPISLTWRRLDDGCGELDVELTTKKKDQVFVPDPTMPSSNITMPTLTVNVTVRLKDGSLDTPPPQRAPTVMQMCSVRPAGSGKVIVAKTYRRWNDPDLTAKRRILLAYLGCVLPLEYQGAVNEKTKDMKDSLTKLLKLRDRPSADKPSWALEAYKSIEPLRGVSESFFKPISLVNWGPETVGTSCVSLNNFIEGALTPNKRFWAFQQHKLEYAWVPCGIHPVKKTPNVGDPYFIFRDKPDGTFAFPHDAHVGFIVHVPESPDEPWITADAGQYPGGSTGFLNLKKWARRIPEEAQRRKEKGVHPPPADKKAREEYYEKERKEYNDKLLAEYEEAKKRNDQKDGEPVKVQPPKLRTVAGDGEARGFQKTWENYMTQLPYANPVEDTEYIYMAGGAESTSDLSDANRLIGWLDLDMIPFKSQDLLDSITAWTPNAQGSFKGLMFHRLKGTSEVHPTINDYWFLGAWIDKLLELSKKPTTNSPTKIEDWIAHFNDPAKVGPPAVPILEPEAIS